MFLREPRLPKNNRKNNRNDVKASGVLQLGRANCSRLIVEGLGLLFWCLFKASSIKIAAFSPGFPRSMQHHGSRQECCNERLSRNDGGEAHRPHSAGRQSALASASRHSQPPGPRHVARPTRPAFTRCQHDGVIRYGDFEIIISSSLVPYEFSLRRVDLPRVTLSRATATQWPPTTALLSDAAAFTSVVGSA